MFGREHEIGRVTGLIDRAEDASSVLVVEGPVGIGKSALLHAVIAHARQQRLTVAVARPTPAETSLGFSALTDLLRHLDLGALEPAPRRILEVTLGRRAPAGEPPTTAQLGVAVLNLLDARAAAGESLVLVVDDLPWADAATRDLIGFVARRLPPTGICLIAGERTPAEDASALAEADRLTLRPLAPDAVERIVRRSLAEAVADHVVDRLVAAAGGNPLFAAELGRTTVAVSVRPGQPLPLPPSLTDAIAGRLEALTRPTREALAAVAMLARPTLGALGELGMLEHVAPAERAGLVNVDGSAVRFSHPLLGSAAHESLTSLERMRVHSRLAQVTSGTERARHRALGATRPDRELADELTQAARAELGRGAAAEAAELAGLALQASPLDDPGRWERMLVAGDAQFRYGRTGDALTLLAEVVAASADPSSAIADPSVGTRALLASATIEYSHSDDSERAARLAREALASTDDPELQARAHSILADVLYTDFVESVEHADSALAILRTRSDPDPAMLAHALHSAAASRFHAGEGLDRAAFDEAIELERGSGRPASDSAYGTLAALLKYADELDESRRMLESLAAEADPGSAPYALGHLPQVHLWTGEWDEAERCARRHLALAQETGQEAQAMLARFNLAHIATFRGDVTEAEQIGRHLYEQGRATGVPWTERNGAGLLGFVAMTTGDAAGAVAMFSRYEELGEAMRLREPGFQRFHADYAEALVAVGNVVRAVEVLDRLEERAVRTGRTSGLAAAHRGRAIVAAYGGRRDEAFEQAGSAIDRLRDTPLRYDRARATLALGVVARRFKERATGRRALEEALGEFEQLGAAGLAERARRELARVAGTRSVVRGDLTLTPTESRVAALAAGGRTTRQIADELFISMKTVEANLTRIYRKLGVSNRAQLATRFVTPDA